ncbi:uncharacterized protein LOC142322887 [Lycorma delicatula]|uniref:uncharacterized protein LOC142322887 n=1 Tax=Lycorma delicatula TaxID=130591 RepID=UPI003F515868
MTVDLPSRKMKYSFLSFFQTPINAIRYGDILMTIFEHWIEFIDLSNQAAYDLTTIHSAVLYRVYVGNIVNAIGPDMSGRYSFLIVKSDDQYNIHVLQSQNIVMMLRKSLGRDPAVGVRV